jgi:hypothetical protein
VVYLIHFHRSYAHARHYVGFVDGGPDRLAERIERHRRGDGARLMEVVTEAGIGWDVVRTWDGGRDLERKLKNRHGAGRFCPCCNNRPKVKHEIRHRRQTRDLAA